MSLAISFSSSLAFSSCESDFPLFPSGRCFFILGDLEFPVFNGFIVPSNGCFVEMAGLMFPSLPILKSNLYGAPTGIQEKLLVEMNIVKLEP